MSDRPRAGRRSWAVLLGLLALLGLAALVWPDNGGPGTAAQLAPQLLLGPDELAAAAGVEARYLRAAPPVDLAAVERSAARFSLGSVPKPADRALMTYRHADTGEAVTQAALLYRDPADAAQLVARAARLLPSFFGLEANAFELDGVSDARQWTHPTYRAVSFRQDGRVLFVGTTDPGADDRLRAWAEHLRVRAAALPTMTPPR